MTGIVALMGGGPFSANDVLDGRLLTEVGADRVVVLPTADAFERPDELVQAAQRWGERLGVAVESLSVFTRSDALDTDPAVAIDRASAVYLVGDSPIHLRSVLAETELFEAIRRVVGRGGLVVGVAGCAAALCDPMTDPRGGAFTIGLGLVTGLAVAPEAETWTAERLHRTRELADTAVAEIPTGSALVRRGTDTTQQWEIVGDVVIDGTLPA